MGPRSLAVGALSLCVVASAAVGPATADSFEALRLERMGAGAQEPLVVRRPRVRTVRPVERVERVAVVPAAPIAAGWSVHAGSTLELTLTDWCKREGWSLQWNSDFAYDVTSDVTFQGSFEDAIGALILGMSDVRPSPTVKLFRGNRQVVVSNMGSGLTD